VEYLDELRGKVLSGLSEIAYEKSGAKVIEQY
jgi:hypothetical protein